MKKWIKISLTNLEKENLDNFAAKREITVSKLINEIILNQDYDEITQNDILSLDTPETTTAFNLDLNLYEKLEKEAKDLKTTKNKLLRYLISKIEIVEATEREILDQEIMAKIYSEHLEEIRELAKKQNTSTGVIIKKVFNQLDFVKTYKFKKSEFKHDFDSRIYVNVSKTFKKAFVKEAAKRGLSEADLLRSIVYYVLSINPKAE